MFPSSPVSSESRHLSHPAPSASRWGELLVAAVLMTAFLMQPSARAGTIHPALKDRLDRVGPGQPVTALFILDRSADIPSLSAALTRQKATRKERHRQVVLALQEVARTSQGPLLAELAARKRVGSVESFTPYWISNLVQVRAPREVIEELSTRSDVSLVEAIIRPELIAPVGGVPAPPFPAAERGRGIGVTPGLRAIRAPEVWYQLGINGAGTLVANLDTGVDGTHPALASRWRGNNGYPWQECWLDVLGNGTQIPTPTGGHGTHVMGTITGLGAATEDTIGVAWGALWIAANAIGEGAGGEFDADVTACYQWFADPDHDPATIDDVPDVVQNSWGVREAFGYPPCDDRWWEVIDNCEAAGIVITFSAGNEGPAPSTLRFPADRATTQLNMFSIGAVDATNFTWPYPIAEWSSRGPSLCPVPEPLRIKPEVSAPGVDVYSSLPGGGYQGTGWSGTSMAGPHVAGVVALMRSVNPDLEVDTIKQILLDTTRDEGTPGEDNDYGYGFIDAYAAVLQCLGGGYGTLLGQVTNTNGGAGVPFARVRLLESGRVFTADTLGRFSGLENPGTYTAVVTHPSFAPITLPGIVINGDQATTQDFALIDTASPILSDPNVPEWIAELAAPVPVRVVVSDFSPLPVVEVFWRSDDGPWSPAAMVSAGGGAYTGAIPPQPLGSNLDLYFHAADAAGNGALLPADAPASFYSVYVLQTFFADDAESDQGWSLVQNGDATNGRWVRWDPIGTVYQGNQVEPASDHSSEPGVNCFGTGQGQPGGSAGQSDIDAGCVNLTSPLFSLITAQTATLTYWRWFALFGPPDGSWQVSISSNDGGSWTSLETLTANANAFTRPAFNLNGLIGFTNRMRLKVTVCDTGAESLVEGALDDLSIQGFPIDVNSADAPPLTWTSGLEANRPNPFRDATEFRFRLARPGRASLVIYDPGGRLVRTVLGQLLPAGIHTASWNGLDDRGNPVGTGVYLYQLHAEGFEAERKLLLLR